MDLEGIFTFGKHKNEQVEDVIEDDPQYIRWLIENGIVQFDDETLEVISKKGIAWHGQSQKESKPCLFGMAQNT